MQVGSNLTRFLWTLIKKFAEEEFANIKHFEENYPQIELNHDNINTNNVLKCSDCYLDVFSFWLVCLAGGDYSIFCSDCSFVNLLETFERKEML